MAGRKSWADAGDLVKPGSLNKLFSAMLAEDDKTAVLPVPGNVSPSPDKTAVLPAAQAQAPVAPAAPGPSPMRAWPAIPKHGEVEHREPSLASRTRPDLPSAAERHSSFSNSYHDPSAVSKKLDRHKGSTNIVFHGELGNGDRYVVKPHEGIAHSPRFSPAKDELPLDDKTFQAMKDEAPDNARRHDATYSIMAAMGAHHMVAPGMQTNVHGRHQFSGPDPGEGDDEGTRLTMASHHAGGLAHVQQFIGDTRTAKASSKASRDGVDAEHRLHGVVAHLLFGNGDGHGQNVLIHKSGHPVLIDHDITLASSQARGYKEHFGKPVVRSVFAPGGYLDYQAKLPKDETGQVVPVGTNFPPRMKETLQRIADGHYSSSGEGNLGLSDADHSELKKNAMSLLLYGVEGTLASRHDPDAEARAQKAAAGGQADDSQSAGSQSTGEKAVADRTANLRGPA